MTCVPLNDAIVAVWVGVAISVALIAVVLIVVQAVADWLRNRGV